MSTPSPSSHIDSEASFTAGLVVGLLSFATVFSLMYGPFMFFVSSRALEAGVGSEAFLRGRLLSFDAGVLVESEKPVKKEADTNVPLIPDRVVALSIGLDALIVNPRSRDYAVLDEALLGGAVYYPGSGFLGDRSNLLLFGHSSFLPIVRNQNYRIFNNIKNLRVGDEIEVYSNQTKFVYTVTSNTLAKEDAVRINFDAERPMITLATCNSFGAKEDRYVVEAELLLGAE